MYDDNKIDTQKKKSDKNLPKHSETKLNFYRLFLYFVFLDLVNILSLKVIMI